MRGGYLTLDFRNRNLKENEVVTTIKLGNRKGLYNYLKNNTKPIQIILSASVCKALYKYLYNQDKDIKDTLYYAFPSTLFNYDDLGANPSNHNIFFLTISKYNQTNDMSYLDPTSIHLFVDENDDVYFSEI